MRRMRRSLAVVAEWRTDVRLGLLALVPLSLLLAGAGCGGAAGAPKCTAGMQISCPCQDGRTSVQVCGNDGRYGACECAGAALDGGGPPSSGGAGGTAGGGGASGLGGTSGGSGGASGSSGGASGSGGIPVSDAAADAPAILGDAGTTDAQAPSVVCGEVGQRACAGNECRASCSIFGVCTLDVCTGEPSNLPCDPDARSCGRAPGDRCGALGTRCCNYPILTGGVRGGRPYCTAPGTRCDRDKAVCVAIDTPSTTFCSGDGNACCPGRICMGGTPPSVCTSEGVCRWCGFSGQPCCPDGGCWDRATCDTAKGMCGPAPGCASNEDCPAVWTCQGRCVH